MKRNKNELISQVKSIVGDNNSDEVIALFEDIADTFDGTENDSVSELQSKITDLENKVKEVDSNWRKKYTDRFSNPSPENKPDDPVIDSASSSKEDTPVKETFDDLFE